MGATLSLRASSSQRYLLVLWSGTAALQYLAGTGSSADSLEWACVGSTDRLLRARELMRSVGFADESSPEAEEDSDAVPVQQSASCESVAELRAERDALKSRNYDLCTRCVKQEQELQQLRGGGLGSGTLRLLQEDDLHNMSGVALVQVVLRQRHTFVQLEENLEMMVKQHEEQMESVEEENATAMRIQLSQNARLVELLEDEEEAASSLRARVIELELILHESLGHTLL